MSNGAYDDTVRQFLKKSRKVRPDPQPVIDVLSQIQAKANPQTVSFDESQMGAGWEPPPPADAQQGGDDKLKQLAEKSRVKAEGAWRYRDDDDPLTALARKHMRYRKGAEVANAPNIIPAGYFKNIGSNPMGQAPMGVSIADMSPEEQQKIWSGLGEKKKGEVEELWLLSKRADVREGLEKFKREYEAAEKKGELTDIQREMYDYLQTKTFDELVEEEMAR